MSHIKTFDDEMLSDALTYINTAIKKIEAMENPSYQVLFLLKYTRDEIVDVQSERYERRRGTEEAYR